jgi:hypothetical protein
MRNPTEVFGFPGTGPRSFSIGLFLSNYWKSGKHTDGGWKPQDEEKYFSLPHRCVSPRQRSDITGVSNRQLTSFRCFPSATQLQQAFLTTRKDVARCTLIIACVSTKL